MKGKQILIENCSMGINRVELARTGSVKMDFPRKVLEKNHSIWEDRVKKAESWVITSSFFFCNKLNIKTRTRSPWMNADINFFPSKLLLYLPLFRDKVSKSRGRKVNKTYIVLVQELLLTKLSRVYLKFIKMTRLLFFLKVSYLS